MTEIDPYDDDVVGEYDIRSPLARTLLTVGVTVLALSLLVVVGAAVSFATTSERTETSTVDVAELPRLVVAAGAADVRVRPADGTELEVTAQVAEGLFSTDFALERTEDGVAVVSGCRAWLVPGCGVEVTLGVPAGLPLELRTTSGDVTLTGLEGVVVVRTGSGDVDTRDLSTLDLDVLSGSGDVTAVFAAEPAGVKARTGSGDIRLEIPAGETRYAVDVATDSGEVSSDLDDDPAGTGFVTVSTVSGDVDVARR